MFASIRGEVIAKGHEYLVLETGGVGFKIFSTNNIIDNVEIGKEIQLFTQLVVREDSLSLFGFETESENEYFNLLLGVNGVGPKLSLMILSTLNLETIRRAVLSEQSDAFARVPGVGKKTAQKIILHLSGKITGETGFDSFSGIQDVDTEVIDALTGLGYSIVEAQAAIQSIPKDVPQEVEEKLRFALKYFNS